MVPDLGSDSRLGCCRGYIPGFVLGLARDLTDRGALGQGQRQGPGQGQGQRPGQGRRGE
jgi:hypothetical protein